MKATRHRQRGVAMIMAVLIVALAVILATQIGWDSTLEQRRSETVLTLDQAFQVAMGAEAWAASYLQEDARDEKSSNSKSDHLGEKWATPLPPIPIDGGEIQGQLEDLQGRFNLNRLLKQDGIGQDELAVVEFRRLLALLQMDPKWTDLIVGWIDRDHDGVGEDDLYSTLLPPYRPPNHFITNTSELLALPGFGLENYLKLEPHVTALPREATLNVCTASGYVLDAMTATVANRGGQVSYSTDLKTLQQNRSGKCFPKIDESSNEFSAAFTTDQNYYRTDVKPRLTMQSSYFRLTTQVTIGTTEFTLYSLLHRDSTTGQVRPILRSFGTE